MVGIPALLLQRVPVALIEVAPGHTSQFTVTARDPELEILPRRGFGAVQTCRRK
jgi:hypothetical protein